MRKLSVIFKLLLLSIILFALYKETYINGAIFKFAFFYFTIQSNIMAALCLLLLIFSPKPSRGKCLIRGISLLMITLTGIVYNFVMYKIFLDWGTTAYSLSRTITHVIAPAGLILDWVLFDKHNMMKIKYVFISISKYYQFPRSKVTGGIFIGHLKSSCILYAATGLCPRFSC